MPWLPQANLEGKGQENHDPPPHMAAIVGLQSYGQNILNNNTYGLALFVTTCSQTKDAKKGNLNKRKPDSDPRALTTGVPKPQVPASQRQVPPM